MASLPTQTLTQILQNSVAAVQGAASQLLDFAVGSILRAIFEANALVALWLQAIALQIAALTRLATSNGSDCDSFGADYGFTRLPALAASGPVTFSRFTSTQQAIIQAATANGVLPNGQTNWTGGVVVQTADGTQQYMVIPDTTQAAYNLATNSYVIPAGTSSITATVQAENIAAATNAQAGYINALGQAVPYVDTVTNAAAFANGSDPESDPAFRARFQVFVANLSKATKGAIANAILGVQQNVTQTYTENYTYGGVYQPGYFYSVVDNGTGYPPSGFLSTVSNAVDAVRPFTSTFGIFAPVVETANVALSIGSAAGYLHASVVAVVQAALTAYINGLPLGATLYYSRLAQVAYDASAGVTDVFNVLLNGGSADLAATPQQIIKAGTVAVS